LPLRPRHGYAVDLHRDLPGQTCETLPGVPPTATASAVKVRTATQPPSTGFRAGQMMKGRYDTGSSRTPSRLAHQARPIRQYWADLTSSRLLPPSPASPESGCRQLHRPATTGQPRSPLTSTRNISASWRTAVFTNSPLPMLEAEKAHRAHAIVEQVIADLKNGPLAHLPSGHFWANSAWLVCATIAFNLTRAAGTLASSFHAKATTGTIRAQLISVPGRLARSARRLTLHLPTGWPWQEAWKQLAAAANSPPLVT